MFINATVPNGVVYLRADRIESVCPQVETSTTGESVITMINGKEWYVKEETSFLMDKIYYQSQQEM
jgi:uncharacterized protein YlzI (FlbEa/FlbD family)